MAWHASAPAPCRPTTTTTINIAGHELQLAEDVFKLHHLLDCNILAHREELEEVTSAAVKEEQIETKLSAIESSWAALNLVRGALFWCPSRLCRLPAAQLICQGCVPTSHAVSGGLS